MEKVLEFIQKEKEILKFWEKNKIFEKSIEQRPKDKSYVFYDGPPFATGLPHYGHILASLIKDVVPRYWTMKGFRVERRWGWDCHGLPVENLVEQELGLKNKKDIEKIGIEKFNEACRNSVLRYVDEWKKVIPRIGRWVNMDNAYKTMDFDYMESIWWAFKQLWNKELVYKDYKSMHICPRCGTTLSNFEVTQGYKNVEDLSVTVKFKLKEKKDTFILAWTTTPWTLPGNVALAIGKDINYVKIQIKNEFYLLAKDRLEVIKDKYKIIEEINGTDLVGLEYEPLFDYFSKKDDLENKENGWKIYDADFVSIEEGTGIVHIAPAFGEDDLKLGQLKKLPFVQHVDESGCFINEVTEWAGEEVKPKNNISKIDSEIIILLEQKNRLFSKEKIIHSYPFCWRCDTPLLNYATSSWFVKVTSIKDKIIKNNEKINWVPEHIKHGRFGKWLEDIRDWSISRSRYWGTPLPIWECSSTKDDNVGSCHNIKVVGSVEELEELSNKKIKDLHRPYIDEVSFKCEKCGGLMKRIPEVFDCWFESGLMPYAQAHYPFENKESFEKNFPAQFVAEGIDQTRGWFYTLMVLSTALFDKPAFLNNIVNGIILTEDGQKMSKRLKNYPEPMKVIDKYGADAMRFYLLTSPAIKADDLRFSENGVNETLKKVLMILWNVYTFYKLYAEEENEKLDINSVNNILDKWILSRLNSLNKEVSKGMNEYDLLKATRPIEKFISDLSTWYLRRSRERFKSNEKKKEVSRVLKYVLFNSSKILAPFIPFFSEQIYQNLKNEKDLESVHLCDYPEVNEVLINKTLEQEMEEIREIASMVLAERAQVGIKVRQPLNELKIKDYKLKG
ncbi:MAG TPA: isoleucine--tRNA ligase, partial [Candidatus Paceibacterota bacterium]|nr:isoleucine--tRNA ligase [Candidatus Paceibacterota bacterium]